MQVALQQSAMTNVPIPNLPGTRSVKPLTHTTIAIDIIRTLFPDIENARFGVGRLPYTESYR